MFGLSTDLKALSGDERQIRIGLVGAGQMGTDIVAQVHMMPGITIPAIADLAPERARTAFSFSDLGNGNVRDIRDAHEGSEILASGGCFTAPDFRVVTDVDGLDVIIEATGSPEGGARAALRTIARGKHVVTMSVEMDVTVGPLLAWYAHRHDVVYTLGAGDEPTALYELYDFATALGLEIVAAGKGKNNPLDREATPDQLAGEAARRGLTPEMLVEFVDGTKTMVEMASVANATGLVPDVRGMHGPRVNKSQFKETFALKEQGGVLGREGVVEYVIGDLAPGVFLVFTTQNPRLREALVLRDMGHGPNYVLLRPFHLCSMEVPLSAAQAVLHRRPTMPTGERLVAEVLSVAKKDLTEGTTLERIGGRTHYGMIEKAEVATDLNALPIGLAKDAVLTRPVRIGEPITWDDVEPAPGSVVLELRRLQDAWTAGRISETELLKKLDQLAEA